MFKVQTSGGKVCEGGRIVLFLSFLSPPLYCVSLSLSHSHSLYPSFSLSFDFRMSVRLTVSTFHCDAAGGRCKFALSALSVYVSVCQLVRSSVLLSLSDQMQMPTVTDTGPGGPDAGTNQ